MIHRHIYRLMIIGRKIEMYRKSHLCGFSRLKDELQLLARTHMGDFVIIDPELFLDFKVWEFINQFKRSHTYCYNRKQKIQNILKIIAEIIRIICDP